MSASVRGFPSGGSQLGHPSDGPGAEFWEDVAQVLAEPDVEAAAGFDDGDDGGDFWAGALIAKVQPVAASEGDWAHGTLAPIVVDLELAIPEVFFHPIPRKRHAWCR